MWFEFVVKAVNRQVEVEQFVCEISEKAYKVGLICSCQLEDGRFCEFFELSFETDKVVVVVVCVFGQ